MTSNAISLSLIASIGIILYACFAYLVAHSKNIEGRRRWRYSILWGVSFGVFASVLFSILSVLTLLSDENKSDFFTSIFSSLVSPVIIILPFVFLVTLGTYWKQLGLGDYFINQLLYPVIKHPSDQSPGGVVDWVKAIIAKLIDG